MATADLKHLGFINSYAASGYDLVAQHKYTAKAASIYNSAKEKSVLKPGLEKLESAVSYYGAPLLSKGKEMAPVLLAKADDKVERTYVVVKKTYEENVLPSAPVKAALAVKDVFYAKHPENLELFKKARDEYFQLIESSIETLKSRGVTLSEEAVKSVKTALESARASAAAAVPTQKIVMEKVYSSWEAIAAQPTVASSLDKVLPKIKLAKEKATVLLSAVQDHPTYKTYAEPYVSRVSSSPYVTKLVDYVRPIIGGPVSSK